MKPALTLSDALQGPPETTVRTAKVISVDGGMAYVVPINSNTGFDVAVGGSVSKGDIVEIQNVRGNRTVVGPANGTSTAVVAVTAPSASAAVSQSTNVFLNQTMTSFVYNQVVPASTWTITHNLGRFPSVTVVDSGLSVVIGDVRYTNNAQIVITFSASFGGTAYLN